MKRRRGLQIFVTSFGCIGQAPASTIATDTRSPHSDSAVCAIVRAILIETFFSDSTCAPAEPGSTTIAATAAAAAKRNDMDVSSLGCGS